MSEGGTPRAAEGSSVPDGSGRPFRPRYSSFSYSHDEVTQRMEAGGDDAAVIAASATSDRGSRKRSHKRGRMSEIEKGTGTEMPSLADKFGVFSDEGYNTVYNQDAMVALYDFDGSNACLFGVFDGHGFGGEAAAHLSKDRMVDDLRVLSRDHNRTDAFREAFKRTQDFLRDNGQFLLCGTTASLALIDSDQLFLAHVGDSRIVIGRECAHCSELGDKTHVVAVDATRDHRVTWDQERERVLAAGGCIQRDPRLPDDVEDDDRIFVPGQVYPGLVTTRTLGDCLAHDNAGVSSEPTLSRRYLSSKDKVLVIASDGVWDVLSSQEVIDKVMQYDDPAKAAQGLTELCIQGWKDEFDEGDNITAIVLYLFPPTKTIDPDMVCTNPAPTNDDLQREHGAAPSPHLAASLLRPINESPEPTPPSKLQQQSNAPAPQAASSSGAQPPVTPDDAAKAEEERLKNLQLAKPQKKRTRFCTLL